jgi:FKBP-type peptidyl-prolyl cis-trans isomerase
MLFPVLMLLMMLMLQGGGMVILPVISYSYTTSTRFTVNALVPLRTIGSQPLGRQESSTLFSVPPATGSTATDAAATTTTNSTLNCKNHDGGVGRPLEWISLTEDGGVQKAVLPPDDDIDNKADHVNIHDTITNSTTNDDDNHNKEGGSSFVISYEGTLVKPQWSKDEVIQCWLSEQQGITEYNNNNNNNPNNNRDKDGGGGGDNCIFQAFHDYDIDELKLTNTEDFFTEAFVQTITKNTTSKMFAKKLTMAARRLRKIRQETMAGTLFDQNDSYTVILGGGGGGHGDSAKSSNLIRGMKIGLATMTTVGQVARIRIRSDYAYGPEGYRTSKGQVIVPPFATLEFKVKIKKRVNINMPAS